MKKFFNDLIKKVTEYISNLDSKGKLILAVIFLFVMFFLTQIIFGTWMRNANAEIKYKKISGEDVYYDSSAIIDNDTYAYLKTIAQTVVSKYNNESSWKELYNYCLNDYYKESVSKGKIKKNLNNFYTKVENEYKTTGQIIPTGVGLYKNNYYILKYVTLNENNEEQEAYIGIILNRESSKYYIWYFE